MIIRVGTIEKTDEGEVFGTHADANRVFLFCWASGDRGSGQPATFKAYLTAGEATRVAEMLVQATDHLMSNSPLGWHEIRWGTS